MAVNLGNVNISLQQFQDISSGGSSSTVSRLTRSRKERPSRWKESVCVGISARKRVSSRVALVAFARGKTPERRGQSERRPESDRNPQKKG